VSLFDSLPGPRAIALRKESSYKVSHPANILCMSKLRETDMGAVAK